MDLNMNAAVTFGELLQKNPQASAFYDRCTPAQRHPVTKNRPLNYERAVFYFSGGAALRRERRLLRLRPRHRWTSP